MPDTALEKTPEQIKVPEQPIEQQQEITPEKKPEIQPAGTGESPVQEIKQEIPKTEEKNLDALDEINQVERLYKLSQQESPAEAIKQAKKLGNSWIIDELHKKLTDPSLMKGGE